MAGVGGDALGGVHGGGIAQGDVVAHVVVVEDGAGVVGEAFGGDASGGGIEAGHPPPVAVTDLADVLTALAARAGSHINGGVVAAADDDVALADFLVAVCAHGGALDGQRVVEAVVERVGHLGGVADQQRVFAGGPVGQVGVVRVGGHRDLVPGVQPAVGAIPADRFTQPVAVPVAQRQGGAAFVGVAHPPHLPRGVGSRADRCTVGRTCRRGP